MDSESRKKLEKLALERLRATAIGDEPWSFLFRTAGSISILYCPPFVVEGWTFDGDTEGLALPWPPERRSLIERGDVNPTTQELRQWREAKRQRAVDEGSECWIAWVVPL